MMEYFGATGPTVRKIAAVVALAPILYVVGKMAGWNGGEAELLSLGFVVGMIFPDLDVFTGWIRTTFQTMLLILFLAAGIMVYPIGWGMLSGTCPAAEIHGLSSQLEPMTVCKLGFAFILGLAAYILAWLAVSWVPARNSFHSWTTAVMLAGGMGLLNQAIAISANPWPLTIGFGFGYCAHILLDGKKDENGASVVGPIPKNAPQIMKFLRF